MKWTAFSQFNSDLDEIGMKIIRKIPTKTIMPLEYLKFWLPVRKITFWPANIKVAANQKNFSISRISPNQNTIRKSRLHGCFPLIKRFIILLFRFYSVYFDGEPVVFVSNFLPLSSLFFIMMWILLLCISSGFAALIML